MFFSPLMENCIKQITRRKETEYDGRERNGCLRMNKISNDKQTGLIYKEQGNCSNILLSHIVFISEQQRLIIAWHGKLKLKLNRLNSYFICCIESFPAFCCDTHFF